MSKKLPVMVELEPGTYYWCSCGKSKKEPFCDGSHKGYDLSAGGIRDERKKEGGVCVRASARKRRPIAMVPTQRLTDALLTARSNGRERLCMKGGGYAQETISNE